MFVPLPIYLGLIWSLMLLGIFWLITMMPLTTPTRWRRLSIVLTLLIALFVRLFVNWFLPVGAQFDIESYRIVGAAVLERADVYSVTYRYPYLPWQMYWSAFALWFSEISGITFLHIVRLLPIIADVAIVAIIWMARPALPAFHQRLQAALLYALNPIAVFVSAYHGQFDALPVLCLIIAALWLSNHPLVSSLALGAGILIKSWPVLGLPVLLCQTPTWRRRIALLTGATLIPLLGVLGYVWFFPADPLRVIRTAISYNSSVGSWGYTYAFRLWHDLIGNQVAMDWIMTNARWLTLTALALIWWFRARHESPWAGVLTIIIGLFACTHGFAIQYLLWPVTFALLTQDIVWLRRYTLAAYLYMAGVYTMLILDPTIYHFLPTPFNDHLIIWLGIPAWIICVLWFKARWQHALITLRAPLTVNSRMPQSL